MKIVPLISQEIALFDEQVIAKELHVSVHVSHDVSQNTDENFLAVILRNLIQNAIKQCDYNATIAINADAKHTITNPSRNESADRAK